MKHVLTFLLASFCFFFAVSAFAYSLQCQDNSNPCQAFKVYCDSGTYIGTISWNGSKWSDGMRADKNVDVVAQQLVAVWGTDCK